MPRPIPGCDLRKLPLTPQDAFVLSRIDGLVSEAALASMTGLAPDAVRETLNRLADLRAVTWDGCQPKPAPAVALANAPLQTGRPAMPPPPTPRTDNARHEENLLREPLELDEDVDLPREKRRRVLELHRGLESLTLYELLGVEPNADKKTVKTAYYAMAGEYHPDKYFRKNLGTFKPRMEAIFGRLTLAHDTLTRAEPREDYDAYLATQLSNRRLAASLRAAASTALEDTEPPRARRALRAEPVIDEPFERRPDQPPDPRRPSYPPPPSEGQRISDRPPPPSSPTLRDSEPLRGRDSEKDRRAAFAARLGAGRAHSPSGPLSNKASPTSAPVAATPISPDHAADDLRRLMQDRQEAAKKHQVGRYVEVAKQAMQRNDPAAAANAYRLALAVDPEEPVIKQAFQEAETAAAALLADGYLKQGEYEEKAGRWREAALSYARAAKGRMSDAEVQYRAANAMFRGNMDLRKAAEHAARSTALDGKNTKYRSLLGQIYMAAGMPNNARRELELAAEQAPSDATIAALLREARNGS